MGDDSWDTNDVDDFQEIDEGQDGRRDDDDRDGPSPVATPAKLMAQCPACNAKVEVEDYLKHLEEFHPEWYKAMTRKSWED